tara:strand:- start:7400 stop:8179 length:780 start_codon:yes stop_codon:yes gene_type:complete
MRNACYIAVATGLALGILAFGTTALSQMNADPQRDRSSVTNAWHVTAFDSDIDTAFEIIAARGAYSSAPLSDQLEIYSGDAADTGIRFRVEGIKMDSTRVTYVDTLKGATTVTTADSLRHFESFVMFGEAAGAITIREASDNGEITVVPIGHLQSYIAHKFCSRRERVYITQWTGNVTVATGSVRLQLRIYPDFTDNADIADGYRIADEVVLANALSEHYQRTFVEPIEIPRNGMAMIVGLGGAVNSDAVVTMSGYSDR